jgi:hypothetical protein
MGREEDGTLRARTREEAELTRTNHTGEDGREEERK